MADPVDNLAQGVHDAQRALAPLVERVRQGDRDALGELLQREQGRLYNVILRMVAHRDDALELTQQTLLQVIEHIDGFKGNSAIGTWMTRIAMNAALSHLRKRRVRQAASLDAAAPGHAGSVDSEGLSHADRLEDHREPSPGSRIEREEEVQVVTAALAAVEDGHRAVLVLRDIDGLDYQRMAEVLDIAVGTVKSRLFRARLALRREVAKLEDPNHRLAEHKMTKDSAEHTAAESPK